MPDYAEIEIMANEIHTAISGCVIVSIIQSEWYLKREKKPEQLIDFEFFSVNRIGKAILFVLNKKSEKRYLASRLGMSGQWRVFSKDYDWKKLSGWAFTFIVKHSQGSIALVHTDTRRSGNIEITKYYHEIDSLRIYGPDIRSSQFTKEWVAFCCSINKISVKSLLLLQQYFPGIENWLASEILFNANLSPFVLANKLNKDQIRRLFESIHLTVNNAITSKGCGLKDKSVNVYGRDNKKCYVCESKIEKKHIRKRPTYWCPKCQSVNWSRPKPIDNCFVADIVKVMGDLM